MPGRSRYGRCAYSMSLEITQREREGINIIDLNGRLTVGPEVSAFRDRIQKLDQPKANVILNMKEIDYVDSTGLGALVMSYTRLQKSGGKIKLLNLSRRSIEL